MLPFIPEAPPQRFSLPLLSCITLWLSYYLKIGGVTPSDTSIHKILVETAHNVANRVGYS